MMGYDWQRKTVIVTGAGTGVGRALCHELASRGAIVYVTARSLEKCAPVAGEILEKGHTAIAEPLDVGDFGAFSSLIKKVKQRHGRLDVLINNAAVLFLGEFYDMDEQSIERLVHTNLTAALVGTLHAYRVMKEQGHGKIVNISSMGGFLPNATMVAYSATKFGLNGLTASLGVEAEPFGVELQVVCLGLIESEMLNKAEMKRGSPQTVLETLPYEPQPVHIAARNVVNGIERGKRFIFTPGYAHLFWMINRFFPKLVRDGSLKTMAKYRELIQRDAQPAAPSARTPEARLN